MNVEMQTHHSCCCKSNTQQLNAVEEKPAGESFSAVFSSVSISTYFNPWTGESTPASQVYADARNSLQTALQGIPNIKLDSKSWLSPQGLHDSLFLVRTMAIRLIRQSQQETHVIKTSTNIADDNQTKTTKTHHCECSDTENSVKVANKDIQTASDKETDEAHAHTESAKNEQDHNPTSSLRPASEHMTNAHHSSGRFGHIHSPSHFSTQNDSVWVHSPDRGHVFTHFKTHLT